MFNELPIEILVRIASFVDTASLRATALVCKQWQTLPQLTCKTILCSQKNMNRFSLFKLIETHEKLIPYILQHPHQNLTKHINSYLLCDLIKKYPYYLPKILLHPDPAFTKHINSTLLQAFIRHKETKTKYVDYIFDIVLSNQNPAIAKHVDKYVLRDILQIFPDHQNDHRITNHPAYSDAKKLLAASATHTPPQVPRYEF